MRMLLDTSDHFDFLDQCVAAKPQSVTLTSYGVWAGILPDGRDMTSWKDQDGNAKFKFRTRDLLESLRKVKDVRILVGLFEYKSCKGKNVACGDCERKYVLDLVRHMNHAEKFPKFKWRIIQQSHVKCAIFTYPENHPAPLRGLAGGRNLTDSDWADVSVELDKMSLIRLQEHVNGIWDKGMALTDAALGKVLADQGISEDTFQSIMASA